MMIYLVLLEIAVQDDDAAFEVKPVACPSCQAPGPFTLDQQHSTYKNYQKITLQARCLSVTCLEQQGAACVAASPVTRPQSTPDY